MKELPHLCILTWSLFYVNKNINVHAVGTPKWKHFSVFELLDTNERCSNKNRPFPIICWLTDASQVLTKCCRVLCTMWSFKIANKSLPFQRTALIKLIKSKAIISALHTLKRPAEWIPLRSRGALRQQVVWFLSQLNKKWDLWQMCFNQLPKIQPGCLPLFLLISRHVCR